MTENYAQLPDQLGKGDEAPEPVAIKPSPKVEIRLISICDEVELYKSNWAEAEAAAAAGFVIVTTFCACETTYLLMQRINKGES